MDYDEEATFAVSTVTTVGSWIAKATRAGGVAATEKDDGTPVTELDKQINAAIHDAVRVVWPHDAVLGEEDVASSRLPFRPGQRVWVADPIDGTWLLAAGLPWSVVSLALVVDGQPRVAVVHDPHTNYTFGATRGGGTWVASRRLAVNKVPTIGRGAVLALPGGLTPNLDAAGLFADVVFRGADVVTVGSAIQDASLVARGFAAGAVYPYSSPWDMAAVALLTTEAGGRCTSLDGLPQVYDNTVRGAVLSNGRIHDELVDLVSRWKA